MSGDKTKKKKKEEEAMSGRMGAGAGAGAGAFRGRRPRRKSDPGASGSSRAKAVLDAPEQPPPCEVCARVFSSWKALFGHMRSHPERPWRGVKPPPVFTPPASPPAPPGRPCNNFDLNDHPMEAPSPNKKHRRFGLDLNKPAPHDDADGDDDGDEEEEE